MPAIFTDQVGAATPYSGIHVYDIAGAVPVADWTNPVLMIGSYDSQIAFLETMFPYTFVNGTTSWVTVEFSILSMQLLLLTYVFDILYHLLCIAIKQLPWRVCDLRPADYISSGILQCILR